ncbi:hypothetical protein QO014_004427 [Kaistia dalseonensis]|uniref:Uncharacterized protein n=1 Tax=Kaistia dalseonensis TaxID=410840 RepID=A0ABU0HCG7_9HYPH|nr:hypothetical protein [Kaistia dalseonensis]
MERHDKTARPGFPDGNPSNSPAFRNSLTSRVMDKPVLRLEAA